MTTDRWRPDSSATSRSTAPLVQLTVKLQFHSYEFGSLDLPIEIRKPNMMLAERTLSKRQVMLPPGVYFVSATLPRGQTLLERTELIRDPVEVTLSPEDADESPHEWQSETHFLTSVATRSSVGNAEPALAQSFTVRGATSRPAFLRVFEGNPFTGQMQPVPPESVLSARNFESGRLVEFTVAGHGLPVVVQHLQLGAVPRNMVLPIALGAAPTLVVGRDDDDYRMDVHLAHKEAELLLRYLAQDALLRADTVSQSDSLNAEALLMHKMADPVAASVGAYVLLRLSDIDRLHDWTRNLWTMFPQVADGAAILGEHLARVGKHEEAVDVFAGMASRGLPCFADGFFYAYDRLSYYAGLKVEHARGIDVERVKRSLEPLRKFAVWIHRQRPLLSYRGIDPIAPDNEKAMEIPSDAMSLAPWLSTEADTRASVSFDALVLGGVQRGAETA